MKLGIVLFRSHDLRLKDQPALYHAALYCSVVLPLYIYSNPQSEIECLGSSQRARASEVFLSEAISNLRQQLILKGSTLVSKRVDTYNAEALANAIDDLSKLLCPDGDVEFFMNTRFEPNARVVDATIIESLQTRGLKVHNYNANLLYDPQDVSLKLTGGGHWGTLMPFLNTCLKIGLPPKPLAMPENLALPEEFKSCLENQNQQPIVDANFSVWAEKIKKSWIATEEQAEISMLHFLKNDGLRDYETRRSRVDLENSVSRLSPYLRHGLLSPRALYWGIEEAPFTKEQKKTFG